MPKTTHRTVANHDLWKTSLIVLAVLLILLNGFLQFKIFPKKQSHQSSAYPGADFLGLKPYLRNVATAGYYTGQVSERPLTDPQIIYPYQRAQYALSPTLLDYYHPFTHQWIILNYMDAQAETKLIKQQHASLVVRLENGISLIRQNP
jgi:hypothetical protein